jgi:hypothetical protein
MSIQKVALFFSAIMIFLLISGSIRAQGTKGPLANVKSIKCTFSLMNREMQVDSINTDEGTAEFKNGYGKYDIIVRYQEPYLHFIQSFLNGPLYTTTVLEKKAANGKWKAMHSRHEFTDFALVGFTSSPEQYYGDCEILK